MNDAENLTKLLGHLPPAVFREFMVDEFSLAMPDLDTKKPKKEQREQMEAVLSALGVSERQRIEEVAERIVLLSDGAGQDVIDGFKDDIFDDAAREAFAAIPNGCFFGRGRARPPRQHIRFGYCDYSFISVMLPLMMLFEAPRRLP